MGVDVDKTQQCSDWLRVSLSEEQLSYAAADVQYLSQLYAVMCQRAKGLGLDPLLRASYAYLPTRVKLDLLGAGDVYTY